MTGVDLTEQHYDGGGPALRDMIAGKADMMFEPMSASIGPLRKKTLRALAVTTAQRSQTLPELPLMSDTLPGYEASATTGIGVPRGTPAEIIDTLNKAINAAYADPAMKAKFIRHRRRAAAGLAGRLSARSSPARSRNGARWSKASGMKPQ